MFDLFIYQIFHAFMYSLGFKAKCEKLLNKVMIYNDYQSIINKIETTGSLRRTFFVVFTKKLN